MKAFCISNVGVDAGLIMVCDEKYYDKWGSKLKYGKNKYGIICSQKIVVEPGTYKVKWSIEKTWNGPISGEGTVKTDSGMIAISDPCYCIKDWDKWLKDTNMGNDVSDNVILIDKMGGDGEYEVRLELIKEEKMRKVNSEKNEEHTNWSWQRSKKLLVSKEKFEAYREVRKSGITNMFNIQRVRKVAKNFYNVRLTKEDCLYIMKNYAQLLAEYQ